MTEGMLPGWWFCRECGLFLDVQEAGGKFQLVRYARNIQKEGTANIEVPRGMLLVLSWEAA